MKKSYSSLNLLQQALNGTKKSSLFQVFFSNRRYITLTIPYYEYLRGKIFAEDFQKCYEEDLLELSIEFDTQMLIYMLYDDFLNQIRNGAKHGHIAQYLYDLYQMYFERKTQEKRVMKPLSPNMFEYETIEEELPLKKQKMAYITIGMKESEILRGEVLLHDLEVYLAEITTITVEQLITIIFLDFIEEVKKDGNATKVQKNILMQLNRKYDK